MQYNLAKLKPTEIAALDKLPVRNQDAIIARFGEPFVPSKAFFLLRDATANFTKSTSGELAYQLDAKLWEWSQKAGKSDVVETVEAAPVGTAKDFLKQHVIIGRVPKYDTQPAVAPPNPTGNPLEEAIEALRTALEFTDDATDQTKLTEAIQALEVALEFA